MATADQDETYACRVEGCNRTFKSKVGRGQHHNQTHDFEKLLKEDLQRIADELDRPPKMTEINSRNDCASAATYQNKFGSWNEALEIVGIEPNWVSKSKSRTELKKDLQRIADELGQTPTKKEIESRDDCSSASTYQREFETWNEALKTVGLELNQFSKSRTELKEDLQRIADELGRTPKLKEIRSRDDCASGYVYHREFETWNEALKTVGLELNQFSKSRTELKEDLQRIADELGRTPKLKEIRSRGDCGSAYIYQREFGTWNDALKAVGLSVNIDWSVRPNLPYAKSTTEWAKIRQSIRQRDGFHCQCCGTPQAKSDRALSIHHITPRREFEHIETPDRFEVQNDPQNLICLCNSCHKSVEGKFQDTDPETFAHKAREYLGYTDENELVQSLTSSAIADSPIAAD